MTTRLLDRVMLERIRAKHPADAEFGCACVPALIDHLDAITETDFLAPLVTEIYQRGLDEPEAAEFLRSALQATERQ